MVEVVTDNKNRSFNDIRTCFGKLGGTLGGPGSVSFNFERRGEVKIPLKAVDEMQLLDWAAEAGANDVVSDAEEYTVYTSFEQLNHVVSTLRQKGLEATSARMIYFPLNSVSITDKTTAAQIVRLCEALEDLDDSQNVWVNFDIPDEIMAGL
jgi:transcriptional/translational regulatory protein YebC/TACO1